jgi:mannitol 2-dehydrogenase
MPALAVRLGVVHCGAMRGDAPAPVELGADALDELGRRGLTVPTYDRARLIPRIVHIGVGGFHRAHLAIYCHELAGRGSDWGICGVGLLPSDRAMAETLAAQDHLYTLTTKGTGTRDSAIVGSIVDYVLAVDDATPAAERIASPATAIVSLTVTESGYDDTPRNRRTFDVIADGLDRRRLDRGGGATVLSCDNLPGNGDAVRRCVLAAATRRDRELAAWVAAECTFPNAMVDRITPATTDADRQHLLDAFGLVDRWPVVAEPFRQWVLEDEFAAGRPDLTAVGAVFTGDVHAWELYKLRLLNAGHSSIAYLSALADITHVDEAVGTPEIRDLLTRLLLEEAVPTLAAIPGHPPQDYVATVIARFANTGVRDQIARLCVDGTSKLAKFLLPTVAEQLELGGPVVCSAHALAGWAHYLADVPVADQAPDAQGEGARRLARAAVDEPSVFVDERAGFPPAVVRDPRFRREFVAAHRSITERGPLGALRVIASG